MAKLKGFLTSFCQLLGLLLFFCFLILLKFEVDFQLFQYNVLVQRTSHVKGLHVQTKFVPVPDNWM